MDGLQGEELAGQVPAEGGLEHQLRGLTQGEHILFTQLISREVAVEVDLGQRHQCLENNLEGVCVCV